MFAGVMRLAGLAGWELRSASCLFYGFDGRAEVMSRVVPRVNFGKKRKEIGDEQVDFG